ncbi:MAG TPA: hypothetical protein VE057_19025 [Archangium sp.]|nr:hypothetical protein [Archangium sp.]
MPPQKIPVPREAAGERLDKFLSAQVPGLSLERARAAVFLWLILLQACSGMAAAQRDELRAAVENNPDQVAMGPRFFRPKPKPPVTKPPPSPAPATKSSAANAPEASMKTEAPQAFDDRKKLLGTDPKRGYLEHEGQVGAEIEHQYGGFKREPSGSGEWVSLGGPYKDKTFDLLGIPPGKARFHSPKLEKFLPSVDAHFRKSIDYVVLDARYMTLEQKKTLMEYINAKWKSEKHRLIILPHP